MSDPLFGLVEKPEQFAWNNKQIFSHEYREVDPTRALTAATFPGSEVSFKTECTGAERADIANSFLRIKVTLTKGTNAQLVPGDNVALAYNAGAQLWRNAEFRMGGKDISVVADRVAETDTLMHRLTSSKSWVDSVGKSLSLLDHGFDARRDLNVYQADPLIEGKKTIEIIWQPKCLSVFRSSNLLSGDFELVFNARQKAEIDLNAVQTKGAIAGPLAANYKILVESVQWYVPIVQVKKNIIDHTFFLELNEVEPQEIDVKSGATKEFTVPSSSHGFTVAYRDADANSNVQKVGNMFKITGNRELNLDRYRMTYNGQSKPSPDGDYGYEAKEQDRLQKVYTDTMLSSGNLFNQGGCETYDEFKERGILIHYSYPKANDKRSTRFKTYQSFSGAALPDDCNVMLFSHYRQIKKVTLRNAKVVEVLTVDI